MSSSAVKLGKIVLAKQHVQKESFSTRVDAVFFVGIHLVEVGDNSPQYIPQCNLSTSQLFLELHSFLYVC